MWYFEKAVVSDSVVAVGMFFVFFTLKLLVILPNKNTMWKLKFSISFYYYHVFTFLSHSYYHSVEAEIADSWEDDIDETGNSLIVIPTATAATEIIAKAHEKGMCGTLKRVMWYFEEGGVVLWRRWCGTLKRAVLWWCGCFRRVVRYIEEGGTLKRVVWYFEEGGVVVVW